VQTKRAAVLYEIGEGPRPSSSQQIKV